MVQLRGISLPGLERGSARSAGVKRRLDLARAVRRAIRAADPRYLPSASPLNRGAVRAESATLNAIALRLEALDRDVSPRGVTLLQQLLADGSSPLYGNWSTERLAEQLDDILDALEGRHS